MIKREYFKCCVCGKFIGYDEFTNKQIKTDYKSETQFEEEKIFYTHNKCEKELIPK